VFIYHRYRKTSNDFNIELLDGETSSNLALSLCIPHDSYARPGEITRTMVDYMGEKKEKIL